MAIYSDRICHSPTKFRESKGIYSDQIYHDPTMGVVMLVVSCCLGSKQCPGTVSAHCMAISWSLWVFTTAIVRSL